MICDPCRDRADKGTTLATAKGRPVARAGCGERCDTPGCLCQHKGRMISMTITKVGNP